MKKDRFTLVTILIGTAIAILSIVSLRLDWSIGDWISLIGFLIVYILTNEEHFEERFSTLIFRYFLYIMLSAVMLKTIFPFWVTIFVLPISKIIFEKVVLP